MKYLGLSILVVLIGFSACSKYKLEPDSPACLKNELKKRRDLQVNDKIDEYEFQGNLVYIFDNRFDGPDDAWPVFDNNCNEIGYLGGIDGNMVIRGDTFERVAIFKRTVWKKTE